MFCLDICQVPSRTSKLRTNIFCLKQMKRYYAKSYQPCPPLKRDKR